MRLAWFSPMPPVRSGIAACSAELVGGLRGQHEIDVFVDQQQPAPLDGSIRSAHEFVWAHRTRPYDLTVYQVGNSSHHDFLWPYLFRYPGLAVLHDAHLHHARAALLLRERRPDDYRAEFAFNQPDAGPGAAELAIAGFDSFLHYQWPFTGMACARSRMVAVHSRLTRDRLRTAYPDTRIEHVRLGHGRLVTTADRTDRNHRARMRFGIPEDATVFGCFGGLTPEKRLPRILDAFGIVLPYAPTAWLLLAGAPAAHYDIAADVARHGLASRTTLTGYLDDEDELTDCVAASDVTLNLRWPTARELSGPWLRCLAAARASIVTDLSHTADVPSLDPRTWTVNGEAGGSPVTVAVDILDEDHSLRLAMRRLAGDPALRDALGEAAREYWMRHHAPAAMLADYRELLTAAARRPVPISSLPAHATDDASATIDRILEPFGVSVPWSKI